MKTRFALRLIAFLSVTAALFSCTAEGGSIYATIEKEQKIITSTLEQTLTILDIVNVPTAPLPYFVAAGAVYNGTLPNGNNEIGWPNVGDDPIAVSAPARGALCVALTYFNDGNPADAGLYGGFFIDGPAIGLYKSAISNPSFTTPVPAMAGKQITLLYSDATNLFAVVATLRTGTSGFTYELDYSSDGSIFGTATGPGGPLTGLAKITGVAFDGANYYVTSGSTLYKGGNPISLASVPNIGNGTDLLQGVTADSVTGYVLIPTANGAVYYSANGSAPWSVASTDDKVNSHSIPFLTVSTHADTSATPGHIYLAGADGAGFYFLDTTSGTLERYSDVTVTGLYAGAVRRILVDGMTVFMGTAGTGLWRATFDPALGEVNSTWIHE